MRGQDRSAEEIRAGDAYEAEALRRLCSHFGPAWEYTLLPRFDRTDALLSCEGQTRALVEVKRSTAIHGTYSELVIDTEKLETLIRRAEAWGVLPVLLWKWPGRLGAMIPKSPPEEHYRSRVLDAFGTVESRTFLPIRDFEDVA